MPILKGFKDATLSALPAGLARKAEIESYKSH